MVRCLKDRHRNCHRLQQWISPRQSSSGSIHPSSSSVPRLCRGSFGGVPSLILVGLRWRDAGILAGILGRLFKEDGNQDSQQAAQPANNHISLFWHPPYQIHTPLISFTATVVTSDLFRSFVSVSGVPSCNTDRLVRCDLSLLDKENKSPVPNLQSSTPRLSTPALTDGQARLPSYPRVRRHPSQHVLVRRRGLDFCRFIPVGEGLGEIP